VKVRHVRASEARRLREIRLRALATDPAAYSSTYARELERPDSWWEGGAQRSEDGVERRFVAVADDGEWVGLALVRPDEDSPGDAVINAMWVAPEARGRGVGRALCEACVAWAAEHGFPAVNLDAKIDNAAAIALYLAVGFVRVGVVDDEFHFTRRLP
jgi:RimJ/RimL family protein N-acetyltransferase